MAHIPSLLQLCAEEVAKQAVTNTKLRNLLKHIQLPKIKLTCIKSEKFFDTCDFSTFINKEIEYTVVIPSVVKMAENHEFQITVGDEKVIYISTLFDLGRDMLKLNFPKGVYKVYPFRSGYILRKNKYEPELEDAVNIFPTRTRYNPIEDVDLLRIFNWYISEHMRKKWFKETRRALNVIKQTKEVPVLFYLTEKINVEDISAIKLTCASKIHCCGNIEVCWYVTHSVKGIIGIAVKQYAFYYMLGVEAGFSLLSAHGYRAIGNFDNALYMLAMDL